MLAQNAKEQAAELEPTHTGGFTSHLEGHKPNWNQRQQLPDLDAHICNQGDTNKHKVAGFQRRRSQSPAQRTCLGERRVRLQGCTTAFFALTWCLVGNRTFQRWLPERLLILSFFRNLAHPHPETIRPPLSLNWAGWDLLVTSRMQ